MSRASWLAVSTSSSTPRTITATIRHSALSSVDIALVGADAVTPDVVVNKVGTGLVALAARERGKQVWVLCGLDKFAPSEWKPQFGNLFEATPRAWFTGVIDDSG